jgi:ATP-binding cassette subfamily A (ABC1) protein 3
MLSEKEKKIRETMKIMGMTSFNYYFTWFIRYFAVYVIVHVICALILTKSFNYINFGVLLITFLLFDLLLIIQSCFIQVFFTRAKIGMVIALLFFVIQYIVSFIIRNSDNPTYQQALYGSISPHSAFASALQ